MTDADAVLAAGLLWWLDPATATDSELLDGLRGLVTPSMLWTRLGGGAPVPPPRLRSEDPHLPLWRATPVPAGEAAERLAQSWAHLIGDHGPLEAVRVEVEEIADAVTLGGLTGVTGGPVSPILAQRGLRFAWRWPLRVGTLGEHAADWADQINHHRHAGEQFTAVAVTASTADEDREVLILDARLLDATDGALWDTVMGATDSASVVIVVGDAPPASLLERVRGMPRIIVAVGQPGVSWWGPVYDELAHDQPLDVALRRVLPGKSLIGGIGRVLDLTAVGHWALEVSRRDPVLADLKHLIQSVTFDGEDHGARAVTHWAGTVDAELTIIEDHGERAAMAPDDEGPPPSSRRLIAAVWDGDTECRRVVPPEADLALEVRIAVPVRGEVVTNRDFPEPDTTQPVADLEVEVTSSVWPAPQSQPVLLPTRSSEASTSAVFDFRSPATGPLSFDIVVRFQGRPLQTATLSAPVRPRAVGHDRVRFLTAVTTAGPVPVAGLTPAAVSLNALTADLTRGAAAIPLGDVQAILDLLERRASQTLGVDPAPATLTEEAARDLLVDLARRGVELRRKLAPLAVPAEGTISLQVHAGSPVLPLELAYEGVLPDPSARLCKHVTNPRKNPPPAWGTPCPGSQRRVCPYAFWGLYRTIIREVTLPPGTEHPRATLTLRPVLYAATEIADRGTPEGAVPPSDELLRSAAELFGAGEVTRVTSWTGWRRGIRERHPQLLVLLAHKETAGGETGLFIGRESFLPGVGVRPDVVGRPQAGAPLPLVLLMACASAAAGTELGTLPGAFAANGAAAVVGTLSKLSGPQGATAGAAILRSLREAADASGPEGITLGEVLGRARRALIAQGLAIGLLLVGHGDIDLRMRG